MNSAIAAMHHWRSTAMAATFVSFAFVILVKADDAVQQPTSVASPHGDISRIVSIGGAVTEILYALGMEKNVVGVDSTSLYPPQATRKPNVGYMRQLSPEGVLGLTPSLIMAIDGSGPKDTMTVLEAAHIPLIIVPDTYSGDGVVDKIRFVVQATGNVARGQCLIEHMRADLDAVGHLESKIGKRKRVLFVLSFIDGRAMAAGGNTAANGIINMAGGINAISDYDGYKPITDEAVVAAKPDVVLAMQRGGPNPVTADMIFAQPSFAATPAALHRSFISMDGLYLLGFGLRTARATRDLAVALYPDLKPEPLPSEIADASLQRCGE